MMIKLIKRIILISISMISFFYLVINQNNTSATEIGQNVYLQRGEQGFFSIQKWNGSQWMYIIHSITNYVDEQGNKRVAYCVSPDLNGIGYVDGEFEGYEVIAKKELDDERLWRVYTNGYPYKSAQDLGVECDEDAYLATKQAGFCILRGYSVDDIRTLFRAGEDPVAGQSLEDIQRRGQKIIDAMCTLVDIGYNGFQNKNELNNFMIEKVGEVKDDKNEEYISQEFKILTSTNYSDFVVMNIESFPEGAYIAALNGNEQNNFANGENFKIMIPKKNIKENIDGTINVQYKLKDYPILYSECADGNFQNYVLCTDEYSNNNEYSIKLNIDSHKSKFIIYKIDKDSKLPISGVKFSIKYKDSQKEIGVYETNAEGKIEIEKLRPGIIEISEIDNNTDYVVENKSTEIDIGYNEEKQITIENELKKGSIKIIKVDSNNNEIRIPGVKFEITNSSGELVSTLVTDENGECKIEKIPINDSYTIRETETNSSYELSDETIEIKLNENEIKTLTFKNKLKDIREKLPRTGAKDICKYLIIITTLSVFLICYFISKKRH